MFYTGKNRSGNSRERLTRAILRVPQQHEREAHSAPLFSRLGYSKLPLTPRKLLGSSF
jgi:hypothetical protein